MTDNQNNNAYFSDEILKAVGDLFLMAAHVEQALALQMARLVAHPHHLDPITTVALQGTETKVRLQQIIMLARYRAAQNADEVIRLCNKIRDAFDTRNNLAHCAAVDGASPDKIRLIPYRIRSNGALMEDKPYHAAQINEATQKLRSLSLQLDRALTAAGITPLPKSTSQAP